MGIDAQGTEAHVPSIWRPSEMAGSRGSLRNCALDGPIDSSHREQAPMGVERRVVPREFFIATTEVSKEHSSSSNRGTYGFRMEIKRSSTVKGR